MNTWYQAKVRYTKQLENGTFKRVSEPYLLSSLSYTDAETRIYEEFGSIIRGEFSITGIVPKDYIDVLHFETVDENWFELKVRTTVSDGEGDKQKTVTQKYLVAGDNVKNALENLEEELKTLTVSVSTIIGISETGICDVFPFREDLDIELSRTDVNIESTEEVEFETETEESEEDYISKNEFPESQN